MVSGAGDLKAADFEVDKVTANVSGAGDAKVNVKQSITANVSGAGSVIYTGQAPSISQPHTVTPSACAVTVLGYAPIIQQAAGIYPGAGEVVYTGQAPTVAGLGTELFYHVARFCRGIGWTIALMYDVWRNYGHELEPLILGLAPPELHDIAKNRAPGWAQDLSNLSPAIADALKQQTSTTGGLSIPYSAPAFKLDKRQCAAAGKACDTANGTVDATNLVTLVLQKAGIR